MASRERGLDIFQMLYECTQKKRQEKTRLLESLGVKEYFKEGSIKIDKRTCKGVECKVCIKACPTNALYWGYGDIKIVEDLCVYCAACVLSCIVDNCIQVTRKRPDGMIERYGKPSDVLSLLNRTNSKRRLSVTERRFLSLDMLRHNSSNK